MDFDSYIQATESISNDAKIIKNQIDESKGELEFNFIKDWVQKKFNSFLIMYKNIIEKMNAEQADYYQSMVSNVFNRTYFRKIRMLKMKKNGARYNEAVNTLLDTFIEFKFWENRFGKVDLNFFISEFSFAEIFLLVNRESEGRLMFEELKKYSSKLKGEDKLIFQRNVEYQLETFVKNIKDKIINQLKIQYNLWTLPYLKRGFILEFPTTIKELTEFGNYVDTDGGQYYEVLNLLEELKPTFNKNEFDNLYKEILVKTDFNNFLKKFEQKFIS